MYWWYQQKLLQARFLISLLSERIRKEYAEYIFGTCFADKDLRTK